MAGREGEVCGLGVVSQGVDDAVAAGDEVSGDLVVEGGYE